MGDNNYIFTRILGSTKYFFLFLLLLGMFLGSGVGISLFIASRAGERTTIIPADPTLSTTSTTSLGLSAGQTLTVNSELQVNGLLSLTPTTAPSQAKAGTLYFDQTSQTLQYYNGSSFVPVASQDAIPQNPVLTVQGQSGIVTFTAGQGININGTTISATSGNLTAVSGTLGQVTVTTNSNGVATISLPQSITPTAIPTFAGLTLSSALGVPYGGTGQTSFTANSVLLGNGTGPLNQAAPAGLGTLCLISISGATPSFQVCPGAGAGASVTVASAGTTNSLAKFSGPSEIVDSSISDNGTLVQISNPLTVTGNVTAAVLQSTGTLTVTPGGAFSLGALNQQFTLNGSAASTIVVQSGPNTTTLGFASPSGTVAVTVPDETGTICLRNSPACGFSTTGSGVSSVNSQTGSVNINNASGSAGSVTINDASTAQKGIAQFNATNFSTSAGTVNTIQGIATTSSPQFANLTVTAGGTLSVNSIAQTAPGQAVTVTAGSDSITFTANGRDFIFPNTGPGSQTICTTGISCVAGGGQAILLAPGSAQTDNTTDVSLYIDKTNTGNIVQLQNSGANRLILSGSGTLSVNTLESISGALTIGTTLTQLVAQGSTASEFRIGSVIYRFDAGATGGPYNICTTANNCSGLTGAVTTPGGTIGRIPLFTGSQAIGDSTLSESGTIVTGSGSLVLQGSAGLTLGVSSSVNGKIDFKNNTNANTITLQSGASTSSFSLTLPVADGIASQCIKTNGSGQLTFGDCLTGSGGGGGVTSLNNNSGSVTIQGTPNQVSVTGTGINPIVLGLPQNIATSSTPTFSTLTLNGTAGAGLSVGSVGSAGRIVLSDGDATPQTVTFLPATLGADKTITIPNFTGPSATLPVTASGFITITAAGDITTTGILAVGSGGTGGSTPTAARSGIGAAASGSNADITATTVLNTITPSGTLTVGATTQPFILQGNSTSTIRARSGSFTTTVGFTTPTADRSINFPDLGGTVCTTANNCIGSGSGASASLSYITVNDETGSLPSSKILAGVGNIQIATNGNNREISTVSSPSFSGTLTATTQVVTNSLSLNGSVVSTIAGTGLQVSGGTLQSTLGTSIESTEITDGTILFTDIAANTCVADQVVKRNPGNTAWICGTDSAGTGTNTFSTIAVPSGTNPIANSISDTLTLANGSGISISGDQSTDTVTIASTLGTSVDLATAEVTGTLPVNRGGTGATTFTTNGVLFGNGTGAIGSTGTGSTGQCLTAVTSNAPIWGSCGSGASTLQQAYDGDADGGGAAITLTTTDGGLFIRDTAGGLSPAFAIQNNGGTVNYLGVSATATTLQDSSGNTSFELNTNSSELRVYENVASPTRYLRMYYDTANNVAVYGASTGTTQIGTGIGTGGDINFLLSGAATDKLTGTKSFNLAADYSGSDFNFVRNLTGTTFNVGGSVAKIEDISSVTSGAISPNILYINQNNAAANGNLILAQTGGAVDKFKVATSGTVTIAAGASYTSAGALTVSAASGSNLTLATGGVGRIIIGASDTTGTVLVLDTKTDAGDPTGVAGAMYYNSSIGSFRCYEGSAWRNCLTGIIRTAAGRTTSSTSYVDVPDMTYVVESGKSYSFRCSLSFSSSNAANGFAFSINGPTASVISYTTSYQTTANATASTSLFTSRNDTAYNAMTTTTSTVTAGVNLAASIEGTFTTTAAGTFAVRYLSETGSDSITINQGSSCTVL